MVKISIGAHTYDLCEGYSYLPCHQWVCEDKTDPELVKVGISDVAVQLLGEISFVELMPHTFLHAHVQMIKLDRTNHISSEPLADVCIEGQKTVFNLYAPCTGEVVAVNIELAQDPEQINRDPYQRGWLFKIRPSQWDEEKSQLWSLKSYISFIESQTSLI